MSEHDSQVDSTADAASDTASESDGIHSESDVEVAVSYAEMTGDPVSGKRVVLTLIAIVIGVVIVAKVWLGPAQKKLNSVYQKQKRMDSCLATVKSNRLLTDKAKQALRKRRAEKQKLLRKSQGIPSSKTPQATNKTPKKKPSAPSEDR